MSNTDFITFYINKLRYFFIVIICVFQFSKSLHAQCITTYPHTETFETAPTWTAGGTSSDWAWGTPSKATITGAGGGTKSWCIAGLSGTTYNNAQQSFIKSPCYDFSTLTYPYVSFKVFWESEWTYDGASLQYSTNGGVTWTTVGAFGDPVNCMTQNWYNKSNITYLAWITPTNRNGWCGNAQPTIGSCLGGSGSSGWVVAKHCLNGLAGQPNVIFRFTFGSGTSCNTFDGFAIDDFAIANAPANAPAFTYTCNNFTAINPSCPTPSTYLWNFGDPASGAANTSTLANPTHNFTAGGIYTVSLTTSGGPCNPPGTISQTVSVLSSSISASSSVTCFGGSNGSATVTPSFGSGSYTYTWLPTGGFSSSASSLPIGNYTVTVKDGSGCIKTNSVIITQPSSLTAISAQTNVSCFGGNNGAITISLSGGVSPYTYTWMPIAVTTSSIVSLLAGTYTCNMQDANNCILNKIVSLTQPSASLSVIVSHTDAACGYPVGSAMANVTGGTTAYTYTWLPSGGILNAATSLGAGVYTVVVTDANLCQVSAITTITNSTGPLCVLTATDNVCYGEPKGIISSTVSGGVAPYSYTWNPSGGHSSIASNLVAGVYTVTVSDFNNCASTQTISIKENPQVIATTSNYSACPNQNVIITGSGSGGVGPYSYYWNIGFVNTPTISVHELNSSVYYLIVKDSYSCSSLPAISNLYIYKTLKASYSVNDYEVSEFEPTIYFNDLSSGNPITWNWNFSNLGSSNSQNAMFNFSTIGTYTIQLNVTDANGCIDSSLQVVNVIPEFTFYAPNAFTPNNNGLNDVFLPKGNGWDVSTYKLWIFDRWGNKVFHTTDYQQGWDGKEKSVNTPNDTYIWKVELDDLLQKSHEFTGQIVIIK